MVCGIGMRTYRVPPSGDFTFCMCRRGRRLGSSGFTVLFSRQKTTHRCGAVAAVLVTKSEGGSAISERPPLRCDLECDPHRSRSCARTSSPAAAATNRAPAFASRSRAPAWRCGATCDGPPHPVADDAASAIPRGHVPLPCCACACCCASIIDISPKRCPTRFCHAGGEGALSRSSALGSDARTALTRWGDGAPSA